MNRWLDVTECYWIHIILKDLILKSIWNSQGTDCFLILFISSIKKSHKIYYYFIINSRTNFYIEYTAAKLDCQGFKKISPTLSVVFFGKMEYGMTKINVQTYLRVSYLTGVEYILYSKRKFSVFKTGYFRKKNRALPSNGLRVFPYTLVLRKKRA